MLASSSIASAGKSAGDGFGLARGVMDVAPGVEHPFRPLPRRRTYIHEHRSLPLRQVAAGFGLLAVRARADAQ